MSEDPSKKDIRRFFDLPSHFEKDDSPEGEFEAVRLSQARSSLFLDMPFFGYILANMEIFPAKGPLIPNFACDTRRIYFQASFLADKSKERLKGILMHLVTHLILKHGDRDFQRNKDIWSLSTDVITRNVVEEARSMLHRSTSDNFISTDSIWDIDDVQNIPAHFKNNSVEEVFKTLNDYADSLVGIEDDLAAKHQMEGTENPKKRKVDWRSGVEPVILDEVQDYSGIEDPCSFGLAIDVFEASLADDLKQLEDNRVAGLIKTSYLQSRDAGNLPGEIREVVNQLIDPKVPWYVLLSQYIQKAVMSDWNWVPPNKKLLGFNLHIPSIVKENLEVVVAIDTSGSISSQTLREFTSETHSIISSMSALRMTIIDCDMKIQQVMVVENGQTLDGTQLPWEGRAFKGRGGTSFVPVFNWVEENGDRPDLLIYFTDGYGPFPHDEPGYPVVWVMTTDVEPPFGDVIKYEPEEEQFY